MRLQTRLLDREEEDDIGDGDCDSTGMTERWREVFVDEMSFKLMTDDGERLLCLGGKWGAGGVVTEMLHRRKKPNAHTAYKRHKSYLNGITVISRKVNLHKSQGSGSTLLMFDPQS